MTLPYQLDKCTGISLLQLFIHFESIFPKIEKLKFVYTHNLYHSQVNRYVYDLNDLFSHKCELHPHDIGILYKQDKCNGISLL